ncbi:2-methylcitrate synthase, mitochondrial [Coniosporium apollinis CBS 100218]|uniref:Citrate synthase n=1 Tax=Coniosporium apollinis (strain CBS 100218) TaxID=1168221 RepID=R7YWU3_CONA1|nr:2-methylcitrate synthase, mitochondrial [Coniosporium apollinis CBS 100218]EON66405.1 2-methylcitrate synthase, mitochondrial [Coniosporium apollinis CBS 100218]
MALSARTASRAFRAVRPSVIKPLVSVQSCPYSSSSEPDLKETLKKVIPAKRELLKKVKSHADKKLGDVKVENTLGGMRGLKAMVWEGSVLDANEGIRFHGRTIKDCQAELPKGTSGTEMLPEAMFWLLLTGEVPSTSQVRQLSRELAEKASIPKFVEQMLDNFPADLHPMTQFACAVSALNYESQFAKMYEKGMSKADYWEPTFDDSISLLAKLPTIAAKIYQNAYRGGGALPGEVDVNQDWSYNFAAMLGKAGKENEGFQDLLRLYLALHGDHEGGNVSAHATHLVGSALSDPFLSYSAGLQGLAGPLHGLAAQEVLRFILQMQESVGEEFSEQGVKDYLWKTLKSGRVIPGYGHAVLRKPDPRFEALMDFAAARPEIANDPVFKLVKTNADVAPGVLKEHGKTKNPYPNVDSSSGVLFHYFGFKETLYYTATFGVSRGLGPLAQLIWDRALGLPIERPKSINLAGILKQVEGQ